MARSSKSLAALLVLVLALSAFGLTGCGSKTTSNGTSAATKSTAIKTVADLKSGQKVAVQSGTTGESWAKENLAPKGITVVPYDDALAAFAALQAGDVVGVINDLPISQDIVKDKSRGLEVVQEIKTDEAYGFAFSKSNTALRDAVDWGLAQVIADGEYDTIYQKWFGSKPLSMPKATSDASQPASMPKTIAAGTITIGSDTAFPPFENVEGGKTVGFDVDLMNAIGKKLGMKVVFKTYKFDGLVAGVQAGTDFDMVASAMTITDERKKAIDFSDPYINSNQSLAVAKAQ